LTIQHQLANTATIQVGYVGQHGTHLMAWFGAVGRIDANLLATNVPDIASRRAHICGPPAMMDAVKTALLELGVPEAQVKTEAFGTITRNPTAKGIRSNKAAGEVVFEASETKAPVYADATILDAADEAGVFIKTTLAAREHVARVG
jgi:ferredoxin-NADP reductase